MSVELVVSRYCEDLSWLAEVPEDWIVTVYDKSQGGPRQQVTLGNWTSRSGPNDASLWPGSIPLPNRGIESQTYMHHIVTRWNTLAEYTIFLAGDALDHVSDILTRAAAGVRDGVRYLAFGDCYECDDRGRPNVPDGFDELAEGYRIFFPSTPLPRVFHWTGFCLFMAHRKRIQRYALEQWQQAERWCDGKMHAIAMERLYDLMLG